MATAAQFNQLQQRAAAITSRTDTSEWVRVLLDLAQLIAGRQPAVKILAKPVSFASANDRNRLLQDVRADEKQREAANNFLLSDWHREARQSGTFALVCSTDNLAFPHTAEAERIRSDPTLTPAQKQAQLAVAERSWFTSGGRYSRWHCVAVHLQERMVSGA